MAARKPLSFNLSDTDPVKTAEQSEPRSQSTPRPTRAKAETDKAERQQVGARIRSKTYRQLKARAALEGRKVQELVELAVEKYLAEPSC